MANSILDNSLTRWLGRAVEHDHYRRLGIRNTMQLSRAFNRLKNRKQHLYRRELYHQLDKLLDDNGPRQTTSHKPRMEDGWALDTSKSLPHLEQMLEDSEQIISERGGVNRGGGGRSFFQQILSNEHLSRYPSILNFATSSDVLDVVIDHLKFIPALSVHKPLGVRLNESDKRFGPDTNGQLSESQLFHCDYQCTPMVYVIVTLREVTLKSGPFCFLPLSASNQAIESLQYGKRGRPYRVTDEEMYKIVNRDKLFEFTYPAGSVLFLDSSRCFHYGSRDSVVPRYLMMYAYVSVCRTDFGDLIRPEYNEPVCDERARLWRSSYPTYSEDSHLRRLLIDWRYMGDD
ncbi:MAG: hypothetical protein CMJ80_10190 [Planctomycetaceae bacterium]|nr:hypothetical protein [Planctomycetaceae bacterium]